MVKNNFNNKQYLNNKFLKNNFKENNCLNNLFEIENFLCNFKKACFLKKIVDLFK